MKLTLNKIHPNPFRHMERYPIKRDKIDALKKSIEDTDFWDNIVAREDGKGGVEIAYGHHRLVALREMYGPRKQISMIVRPLSDTDMARIMAHENMEEWGSQADVEQETIRAIVEGYAAGLIELGRAPAKSAKSKLRYAPNFKPGNGTVAGPEHPYTADMLVEFLGWNLFKVETALSALSAIEDSVITEAEMRGLTTKQAEAVTTEARRSKKSADRRAKALRQQGKEKLAVATEKEGAREAKQVARGLQKKLTATKGSIGTRDVRDEAEKIRHGRHTAEKETPDINPFARSLASTVDSFLDPDKSNGQKLADIIKFRKYLDMARKQDLLMALKTLRDYCETAIAKLED